MEVFYALKLDRSPQKAQDSVAELNNEPVADLMCLKSLFFFSSTHLLVPEHSGQSRHRD